MIRRILPAVLLPFVITGFTLAGVAWNRSGGRGPIELSDRELSLAYTTDENSARSLWIRHADVWWSNGQSWLTREKLAALGFDTSVDAASPDAEAHYRRELARLVYVALENDGPAFQAWAREYELNVRKWTPGPGGAASLESFSRLVAVDAALDAATLEAKYPGARTHLITRGIVRASLEMPSNGPRRLSGHVMRIAPDRLHVPVHLAQRVISRPYRVTVRYGRRYEPWIVTIE